MSWWKKLFGGSTDDSKDPETHPSNRSEALTSTYDLRQSVASLPGDTPLAAFLKGLLQENATPQGLSDLYAILKAKSEKIYPSSHYPPPDDIRDALTLSRAVVQAAPASDFAWACHCLVLDCAIQPGFGVVKYEDAIPELVRALDRVSSKYLETCLVAGYFFSGWPKTRENLVRSSGAFKLALTFDKHNESALAGLAQLHDKHGLCREALQYYEMLTKLFPDIEDYGAAARELRGIAR